MWFHREDRGLFAFAGLWKRWRDPKSEAELERFTIVTTSANSFI
jgi:putative SOS response-associated peptidase YedK